MHNVGITLSGMLLNSPIFIVYVFVSYVDLICFRIHLTNLYMTCIMYVCVNVNVNVNVWRRRVSEHKVNAAFHLLWVNGFYFSFSIVICRECFMLWIVFATKAHTFRNCNGFSASFHGNLRFSSLWWYVVWL